MLPETKNRPTNRLGPASLVMMFVLLLAACTGPASSQGRIAGPVSVLRVVDGDTFHASLDSRQETVRLIGVDTPETKHPTLGVEPYGPEASAFTTHLLEGQRVYLEFGVEERDQYGRVLAYAYLPHAQGTWQVDDRSAVMVNEQIALQGLADVLVIPPNVKHADRMRNAVASAREAQRGMWTEWDAPGVLFDPAGPDRDCGDFPSQEAAQAFFEAAGPADPHRLDGNDDGIVCTSLPS